MLTTFFPMSRRESQNSFRTLQDQLSTQAQMLEQLSDNLKQAAEKLESHTEELLELKTDLSGCSSKLSELNSSSQTKLDSICSALFHKEQPLDVRFEREYYKDFPAAPSEDHPDFQKDFLALTQHLDSTSLETISLALKRLFLIKHTTDAWMAPYSAEEKKNYQYMLEHFIGSIIPLSPNCFFWNGYLLPINHFEPCVFWERCGIPHLDHPERLSNSDIIDAGAFIGDSALIFSELTSGLVHAFEPVPENYQHMLKTIKLNEKINIIPRLASLGDQHGKLTISINDSSSTHFKSCAMSYQGVIESDMITLDDYVEQQNLSIGLIKADVEGAEQMLLRGAIKTIQTQRPALLISIYHNADDFFHIKPMLESLNLGYRFKIRHPVCGSVLTETILIAEAN